MMLDDRILVRLVMGGAMALVAEARQMGAEVTGGQLVNDLDRVVRRRCVGLAKVARKHHQDQRQEDRVANCRESYRPDVAPARGAFTAIKV